MGVRIASIEYQPAILSSLKELGYKPMRSLSIIFI